MFRFIRKKIVENIIKDIIKDLPKYKVNALNYFKEHKEEIIEKLVNFVQEEVLKKVVIIAGIMALSILPVMAEEQQEIKNDQAYFTANLQKQPEKDNKQKIQNHFSFFVINIQINGKLKDLDTAENVR